MLTEEQRTAFAQVLMQICASRSYTYRRNEGDMVVWECGKCGTLVKDNPRKSRLGWFHQKLVQQGVKCSCGRDFSACDYPDC